MSPPLELASAQMSFKNSFRDLSSAPGSDCLNSSVCDSGHWSLHTEISSDSSIRDSSIGSIKILGTAFVSGRGVAPQADCGWLPRRLPSQRKSIGWYPYWYPMRILEKFT